jgi:hypothetical protein
VKVFGYPSATINFLVIEMVQKGNVHDGHLKTYRWYLANKILKELFTITFGRPMLVVRSPAARLKHQNLCINAIVDW